MSQPPIRVFGVRHHGPGSAASLALALEAWQPDLVVLEGPSEMEPLLPLADHPEMQPPVAVLIHGEGHACYYPWVEFSPEWVALRHALARAIPVRLMDLPQSHDAALEIERERFTDPLAELARAAGFEDGEAWWEWVVEQRPDGEVFEGILEAMRAVRGPAPAQGREALREAWMRRTLRQARKDGFGRIACVCGAWHAPALEMPAWPSVAEDEKLLKGLPKKKLEALWIPWTYQRMALESGYGAGLDSPEFYHLIWQHGHDGQLTSRWMVLAAQLLRSEDLSASPASVVEAVRLAEALAALRGRNLPSLAELEEAALAVLCGGAPQPLALVRSRLVVGQRMGQIPADAPQVPLARDVAARAKRLRLPMEAAHRDYELDLRKSTDLERSQLLHRLHLLEVGWGQLRQSRGLGTFKETWRLQWQPEFALDLVRAAPWGNTLETACQARVATRAQESSLPRLVELVESVLLADLSGALADVLAALQGRAALASDPALLLQTLPPFARILRYPDVRGTDSAMLRSLLEGLLERLSVGLPLAVASLNDEAAEAMMKHLGEAHQALLTLTEPAWLDLWLGTLVKVAEVQGVHGFVAGRVLWILSDLKHFPSEEVGLRLGRALSLSGQGASFVEGLLRDHGEILVHAPLLVEVIDNWICGLSEERFIEVLPLLRRTFSSFPRGVRSQLIRPRGGPTTPVPSHRLDPQRVARVLPVVQRLLGQEVSS